jgi:hypothetical protein
MERYDKCLPIALQHINLQQHFQFLLKKHLYENMDAGKIMKNPKKQNVNSM